MSNNVDMKSDNIKNKSVILLAASDITDYLHENYQISTKNNIHEIDTWIVTPNMLFTKEQKILNNKLGLHKVNKQ